MIKDYIIACLNTSKPTRVDVATYVYDSLAKDGGKMKIHDISKNLGKNLLITPLLCISLTRNALLSL